MSDSPGDLTQAVLERLRAFERLLVEYAPKLGLVSAGDLKRAWDRHILDSLRALDCLEPGDRLIVDLGSGAGLPGVPVAIARPDASVLLIEPKGRRAAFLELVVERLGMANASVFPGRAEEAGIAADLVLARAFASPTDLWRVATPLLGQGGRVVYFAGRSWGSGEAVSVAGATLELCAEARLAWQGPLVTMRPAGPPSEDG